MTRYMVSFSNVMDNSFDTYEEAENRVIEIKQKYPWITDVTITEYTL